MTPSERDHIIEHWLDRRAATPAAASGDCLDAETVSAWVDGALSDGARASVLAHTTSCERCRALVHALVASAPLAQTLTPGAAPASTGRRHGWVRWVVPLTAAAAATLALAIWLRAPLPGDGAASQVVISRDARPAVGVEPAPADDAVPPPEAGLLPRREPDIERPVPTPDGRAVPMPMRPERAAPAPQAGPAAVAPAAPSSGATAGSARAKAGPASTLREAADSVVSNEASPAPIAAPPAGAADNARRTVRTLEVSGPDAATRWRVVGTVIEWTRDAGRTWVAVDARLPAPPAAGASPSATVCWLVGPAGLIYRTVDGPNWAPVTPPGAVDITTVDAASGERASITAVDGRRYVTVDGGRTWQELR